MTSRIEQLQEFANEDPSDPFILYALALEYQKLDELKAIALFVRLVHEHAQYVPTYYQLAKLYQQGGENEKSLQVFDHGIEIASKNHDLKALRELREARQELLLDE